MSRKTLPIRETKLSRSSPLVGACEMYRPADRFSWRDAFKCSCLLVVLALTFISISISTTEESRQTFYDILHVPFDATDADIKKSYRLLALEYHPDKIFQFNPAMTEEEKNETNDIFLKVQEAYETLHDSERRLQYDLKLTGVQYDIVEDEAPSPYMSRPFQLFVKSPRFKMAFYANFAKPKVPDIHIIVDASLENALHGLEVNQKFYRRVICSFCRGKGGLDGECKGCMQCDGTGVAKLLYSHYGSGHQTARSTNTPTFEQMSESTCQSCQGKGCIPTGKCLNCQGSGIHSILHSTVKYT